MKKSEKKIIYYKDELKDDFAGTKITPDVIDSNYDFVPKNAFYKILSQLLRIVAMPIISFIAKIVYGVTIKNKKALKGLKGCYVYGNHTGVYDAFTPNLLSFPYAKTKIIASPDSVSIKGLKNIVKMLGVIPVPTGMDGLKEFTAAVEYCHERGENIAIYPEAHIWPYYTGVRNFPATSFRYPVKDGAPVIAFFTAYTKPRGLFWFFRKVKTVVYVSDPIYPDKTLAPKKAQIKLRNDVYDFFKDCSQKYSDFEYIRYKKLEENILEDVA